MLKIFHSRSHMDRHRHGRFVANRIKFSVAGRDQIRKGASEMRAPFPPRSHPQTRPLASPPRAPRPPPPPPFLLPAPFPSPATSLPRPSPSISTSIPPLSPSPPRSPRRAASASATQRVLARRRTRQRTSTTTWRAAPSPWTTFRPTPPPTRHPVRRPRSHHVPPGRECGRRRRPSIPPPSAALVTSPLGEDVADAGGLASPPLRSSRHVPLGEDVVAAEASRPPAPSCRHIPLVLIPPLPGPCPGTGDIYF